MVVVWLLALGEGDRRCGLLPTVSLLPGLTAVAAMGIQYPAVWLSALVAVLPYLAAYAFGQVGGGDVKLAFIVGGLLVDPVVAIVAVGLAQVVGLLGFWLDRRYRGPHGPSLGGVAAVLVAVN